MSNGCLWIHHDIVLCPRHILFYDADTKQGPSTKP